MELKFGGFYATSGGPVCVATPETAVHWNGVTRHYWELIDGDRERVVFWFATSDNYKMLIFNTGTGNFVILKRFPDFAVMEIDYRPETGFTIESMEMSRLNVIRENSLFFETNTPGLILFDSTLHGREIESVEASCLHPYDESPLAESALLNVGPCAWDVSEVELDEGETHMTGAFFVARTL